MKGRCLFLFFVLLSCVKVFAQNPVVDSLLHVLKTEKEDTNKAKTLHALSEKLWRTGKYDSSMDCGHSELALANKIGYKAGVAGAFKNIGVVYYYKSNYPKSLAYQDSALTLAREIGDKLSVATILGNIGVIYQNQGNYPQALDYDFQALTMNQKIANKKGIAANLSNMGIIYYQQKNYQQALEYYNKALALNQEIGKKSGIAVNLINIGAVYFELGNDSKALEYDSKAIEMNEKIGNKQGLALNLGDIANVYMDEARKLLLKHEGRGSDTLLKKTLECDLRALSIDREIGDKDGMATVLGNTGSAYILQKNYKLAKAYLDSALTLSKAIGQKEDIVDSYRYFVTLDSATGNDKAALDAFEQFVKYRDSLLNDANEKKALQTQMNFAFQRKTDSAKAEQDKLNLITEKKDQNQKMLLYSFIGGFVLMLALALFIFMGYRQKQMANKIIIQQKELVEEKNREILDSIIYAKRLQEAILPPINLIEKFFPDSFVFYSPKDIVAGDFYWMERSGDNILIAAADCTGHGVPGALVSVICSNALNRTVKEFRLTEPGKVLDKVRELVVETFEKSEKNVQDGMDISLCCINDRTRELKWSGAYNPLWYIQNGQMKELIADKQPIGKNDKPSPFNTHTLKLEKGDSLYLFSDGYADQFGGSKGKKFKYKQLQEILLANAERRMEEQKIILEGHLDEWKGDLEQVDDILIIGIKV